MYKTRHLEAEVMNFAATKSILKKKKGGGRLKLLMTDRFKCFTEINKCNIMLDMCGKEMSSRTFKAYCVKRAY